MSLNDVLTGLIREKIMDTQRHHFPEIMYCGIKSNNCGCE